MKVDELCAAKVSKKNREIARGSVDGVSHADWKAWDDKPVIEPRFAQVNSEKRRRVQQ